MNTTESRRNHEASPLLRMAQRAPMLDAETERALLTAAKEGDRRAVQKLVVSHLRIVLSVARSFRRAGIPMDDLLSEGTLGLMEAIRRFDLGRENRFATYAAWWVKARLRRYTVSSRHMVAPPSTRNARKILRAFDRTSKEIAQRAGRPALRHEIAAALDVSAEEVAMVETVLRSPDVRLGPVDDGVAFELPTHAPSPEQEVVEAELRARQRISIDRAFAELSPRERTIVERRILEDDAESLSVLGQEFGVSRERVRQIQHQVQSKLRARLKDQAIAQ